MKLYEKLLKPLLFRFDPETAHNLALRLMRMPGAAFVARLMSAAITHDRTLERHVFGLRFPNPVCLAAGFDKNAVALKFLSALGFGGIEIGTVTARPQIGNPRPRMFRDTQRGALLNRMGFNGDGSYLVGRRLDQLGPLSSQVGVSIGKNKDVSGLDDAIANHLDALRPCHRRADYVTLNVASPNTPGLRDLLAREPLTALTKAIIEEMIGMHAKLSGCTLSQNGKRRKPLLIKLSPDMSWDEIDNVIEICHELGVDGLIATNTSINPNLIPSLQSEAGGRSGKPLFSRMMEVVKYLIGNARLPIIASGGIGSNNVKQVLDLGASLVQVYTSFVYEGPSMPSNACQNLFNGHRI